MLKLLYPKSIAVIGASRNRNKVGNIIFRNLLKSNLKIYPVNPNAKEVEGVKSYKSVLEIPDKIDVAIIIVKNYIVPKVLEEVGKKGIKYAIIISAGFSEAGNQELENRIIEIAKKYNIRILGPNCFGIINSYINLNATFYEGKINKGNIALISQSGAIISGLLDIFSKENIGFKYLISIGNQADLKIDEFLKFFNEDEDIKAIFLYLEGIKDKSIIDTLKEIKKPIFILKGGRTKRGIEESKTHTGSISTNYEILRDVFESINNRVKFINSIRDIVNLAKIINIYKKIGDRFLVISNAGGLAVLTSDFIEKYGLKLIDLDKETLDRLNKILPEAWNKKNPIDILGDADFERYKRVIEVLKNIDYDFMLVLITPQAMLDVEKLIKYLENVRNVIVYLMYKKELKTNFFILKDLEDLKYFKYLYEVQQN